MIDLADMFFIVGSSCKLHMVYVKLHQTL